MSRAPTAVEVGAALQWLLTRAGFAAGHEVRVSRVPSGLGSVYWVEVAASTEGVLSKALLEILGYRVPTHVGSFRLYTIEAQLVVAATRHSDVV